MLLDSVCAGRGMGPVAWTAEEAIERVRTALHLGPNNIKPSGVGQRYSGSDQSGWTLTKKTLQAFSASAQG